MTKSSSNFKSDIITLLQQNALEEIFSKYQQLSDNQCEAFSVAINLNYNVIKKWFEKRRKEMEDISKRFHLKECIVKIEKFKLSLNIILIIISLFFF